MATRKRLQELANVSTKSLLTEATTSFGDERDGIYKQIKVSPEYKVLIKELIALTEPSKATKATVRIPITIEIMILSSDEYGLDDVDNLEFNYDDKAVLRAVDASLRNSQVTNTYLTRAKKFMNASFALIKKYGVKDKELADELWDVLFTSGR